jgi:hypothetical protein
MSVAATRSIKDSRLWRVGRPAAIGLAFWIPELVAQTLVLGLRFAHLTFALYRMPFEIPVWTASGDLRIRGRKLNP